MAKENIENISETGKITNMKDWAEAMIEKIESATPNEEINDAETAKIAKQILPQMSEYGNINTAFFFINCMRIALWSFILGFAYYFIIIFHYKPWGNDLTDKNINSQDDLDKHAALRGQLASGFSVLVINTMGMILNNNETFKKEYGHLYTVNLGFIFSNIFGFYLDKLFGTAEGHKILTGDNNDKHWFDFTVETFSRKSFFRFMVTVLLDMFISEPIQDSLKYTISISGAKDILQAIVNTQDKLKKAASGGSAFGAQAQKGPEDGAVEDGSKASEAVAKEKVEDAAAATATAAAAVAVEDVKITKATEATEGAKIFRRDENITNRFNKKEEIDEIVDKYKVFFDSNIESNFTLASFSKDYHIFINVSIFIFHLIAFIATISIKKKDKKDLDKDTKIMIILFSLLLFFTGRFMINLLIPQLTNNEIFKTFGYFDKTIANNFDSILQSIVALITFFAYTNQTRFHWAYPAPQTPRIDNIVIQLSLALSLALYFSFAINTPSDSSNLFTVRNASTKTQRLIFVFIAIALCSAIGSETITPPKQLIYTPTNNSLKGSISKIETDYTFWHKDKTRKILTDNYSNELFAGYIKNIDLEGKHEDTAWRDNNFDGNNREIDLGDITDTTSDDNNKKSLESLGDITGFHKSDDSVKFEIKGVGDTVIGEVLALYTTKKKLDNVDVTDIDNHVKHYLVVHISFDKINDARNFDGFKIPQTVGGTVSNYTLVGSEENLTTYTYTPSASANIVITKPPPKNNLIYVFDTDLQNLTPPSASYKSAGGPPAWTYTFFPGLVAKKNAADISFKAGHSNFDFFNTNIKKDYVKHMDNLEDTTFKYRGEYETFIRKWEEQNSFKFYLYKMRMELDSDIDYKIQSRNQVIDSLEFSIGWEDDSIKKPVFFVSSNDDLTSEQKALTREIGVGDRTIDGDALYVKDSSVTPPPNTFVYANDTVPFYKTASSEQQGYYIDAAIDLIENKTAYTEEISYIETLMKEVKKERREIAKEHIDLGPLMEEQERSEMLFAGDNRNYGIAVLTLFTHIILYLIIRFALNTFEKSRSWSIPYNAHILLLFIISIIYYGGVFTDTHMGNTGEDADKGLEYLIANSIMIFIVIYCVGWPFLKLWKITSSKKSDNSNENTEGFMKRLLSSSTPKFTVISAPSNSTLSVDEINNIRSQATTLKTEITGEQNLPDEVKTNVTNILDQYVDELKKGLDGGKVDAAKVRVSTEKFENAISAMLPEAEPIKTETTALSELVNKLLQSAQALPAQPAQFGKKKKSKKSK